MISIPPSPDSLDVQHGPLASRQRLGIAEVGYGDINPVTPEGRIAASAMRLLGIGLFSAVTAIVTSYLMSQSRETRIDDPIATIERLGDLARNGSITADGFTSKRLELLARI